MRSRLIDKPLHTIISVLWHGAPMWSELSRSCHGAAGVTGTAGLFLRCALILLLSDQAELSEQAQEMTTHRNCSLFSKQVCWMSQWLQHDPWFSDMCMFFCVAPYFVVIWSFHSDFFVLSFGLFCYYCMLYIRFPLLWRPLCLSLDFLFAPLLANLFSVKAWISQTLTAARKKGIGLIHSSSSVCM